MTNEMINEVVEEMVEITEVAAEPVMDIVVKADGTDKIVALVAGIGIGLVAKPVYNKVLKPTAKKVYSFITKPKQVGVDEPEEQPVMEATIKEESKESKK